MPGLIVAIKTNSQAQIVIPHEKFVVICDTPVITRTEVVCPDQAIQSQSHKHLTAVSVMSPEVAENVIPGINSALEPRDPQLAIDYLIDNPMSANSTVALSENTLKQLSQSLRFRCY